jgi:hypothetical protein
MPFPAHASKAECVFYCEEKDLTIEATDAYYELRRKPRGRIVRVVTTSGDEYSKHVAVSSPLTNLQRAVEMAKRLEWLSPETEASNLNFQG